jgi:hypothetical protein
MIDEAAASELDALRVKYKSMVDENNALSIKVIILDLNSHSLICIGHFSDQVPTNCRTFLMQDVHKGYK